MFFRDRHDTELTFARTLGRSSQLWWLTKVIVGAPDVGEGLLQHEYEVVGRSRVEMT